MHGTGEIELEALKADSFGRIALMRGADGARFVRFICEALEDPFLISL